MIDIKLEMTYDPYSKLPHYILATGEHRGVKFYVCNINGSHPTAYIRIPKNKPLWFVDYFECDEYIEVHGGFTYARDNLDGVENNDHSWFIGWDYGHHGDYFGHYLREPKDYLATHNKKWTTDEIIAECELACEEVAKLWETENIPEVSNANM